MQEISAKYSGSPFVAVRAVKSDDLAVLAGWWDKWHGTEYPVNCLSNIGIVIELDGKPAAAGYFYETNSNQCFSDFCIVNPELPKKQRDIAIKNLMFALVKLGELKGFEVKFVHAKIPSLKKRLFDFGFVNLGEVTYFGRALNV